MVGFQRIPLQVVVSFGAYQALLEVSSISSKHEADAFRSADCDMLFREEPAPG